MSSDLTDRIGGARSSLAFKAPCRAATTANITLSGLQTVDGVVLAAADRVLVKNQTDATQNGIYLAATGTWTRAKDFDGTGDVVKGTRVYVHSGSVGVGEYIVTAADPIVIGTGSITVTVQSGTAPADAPYLVGAANGTLTAERVVTDTATISWDLAAAGQAKANIADAELTALAGVA
ncbi:MAG: hypothetical protein ACREC6_00330, partial [Hyphomicrobiaceae bacterium]